ncbi:hypothetical protein [Pedobacter alpinus]|uniref:Outer membrane protein beta-barrel domain-containing protein n=1 Tax=Pedobacter alpinus TaxID=1590643 RepID=A0ABW5TNW3_9SPHI
MKIIFAIFFLFFFNNSFTQTKYTSHFGFGFGLNTSKINVDDVLIKNSYKNGFDMIFYFHKQFEKKILVASGINFSFNNYLFKGKNNEINIKYKKVSIPIIFEYIPFNKLPVGVGLGPEISISSDNFSLLPILNDRFKPINSSIILVVNYAIPIKNITIKPQISYERTISNFFKQSNAYKSTYNLTLVVF